MTYLLALDQGTTSSRALVFNDQAQIVGWDQQEFPQLLPQPGHVEHDPEAIWSTQLATGRRAIAAAGIAPEDVAGIGIANQRETVVLWDRSTGEPVANAMVWQSRASAGLCRRWLAEGHEPWVRERTGLLIDPYFSATKIAYLLERDPDLRQRAQRGEIAFGTVDSFLIWRLTGGRRHCTDVSNASRTLLMNLQTLDWDPDLLELFGIPAVMLPEIVDSAGELGVCDARWFGAACPITGVAGDQQAATFGQRCFEPGSVKCTYGTGCFALMTVGDQPLWSQHRLLGTVGWRRQGQTTYCLEGSVFVAGAVVQWLRDQLGWIEQAHEVEALAQGVESSDGVVLVPAFTGLGAPHWDPAARGSLFGLTRGTTKAHIARAAIESIAFQTADLIHAMQRDFPQGMRPLRVDGGAARNNLLLQIQADWLDQPVIRAEISETTALGAAFLAGLGLGIWSDLDELQRLAHNEEIFSPQLDEGRRAAAFARWRKGVARSLDWETED